jgi:hypothetical protein
MYSLNTENPGDYLWDRLWMNGAEIRGGCERLLLTRSPLLASKSIAAGICIGLSFRLVEQEILYRQRDKGHWFSLVAQKTYCLSCG